MKKRSLIIIGIVLLVAFGVYLLSAKPVSKVTFDQTSPTATEVFDLRSKCAELGKGYMKEHFNYNQFATPIPHLIHTLLLSHYNSNTNHCYLEITANWDGDSNAPYFLKTELIDGQTEELLLDTIQFNDPTKIGGHIYDRHYKKDTNPNDEPFEAGFYIHALLEDKK